MDGIHAGVHIRYAVPAALAEDSHVDGLVVQLLRESHQNLHTLQQIMWRIILGLIIVKKLTRYKEIRQNSFNASDFIRRISPFFFSANEGTSMQRAQFGLADQTSRNTRACNYRGCESRN